ncbi:hypothetical protein FQA39_LY11824 [Lamprigera yunnana]|nr:hypothetical protein FQA39_LY11824 [Lamprigera yunnana]
MYYMLRVLILIYIFKFTTCALLLWSTKTIEIPALSVFNNDDLKNLENRLHADVIAFNSKTLDVAHHFNVVLNNKTTTYAPNAEIFTKNAHDVTDKNNLNSIKEILMPHIDSSNTIIALIVNDGKRFKRKAQSVSSTTQVPEIYLEPVNGPVLYSAVSQDKTVEAMIFSSKPPLLKMNETNISLGNATITNMDIRDFYTRLIATIPVDNGKISLRFRFYWVNGYWYLNSVEVEFVEAELKQYNLTLNQDLTASRHFSYHCGGSATFVDIDNSVELQLFDVQVQPDAHEHRFDDAYNCVPFTTAPILSGIFVTFILQIGLIVGFTALSNIKTMDKFDNHKTKQLTITVWE